MEGGRYATWDNPNLNLNGNPRALSKSLNVIAIVDLPNASDFDLLTGVHEVLQDAIEAIETTEKHPDYRITIQEATYFPIYR